MSGLSNVDHKKATAKESFSRAANGRKFFVATRGPFENADNFTKIHTEFYKQQGRCPTLTEIVEFHSDRLGIDKNSFEYKAMYMLARRANIFLVQEPPYHNRHHFVDVVALTANFLEQHQQMADEGRPGFDKLSAQEVALTMTAAIGHDLDHDGNPNPKSDKTSNEEHSFRAMLPYLNAADFSKQDIEKVHTIIIATSPNGPSQYLNNLVKANDAGRDVSHEELQGDNDFSELKSLTEDKKLLQMAAMVVDADLYASSGAGYKSHAYNNAMLTKESRLVGQNIDFTKPESSKAFFEYIVGREGYASKVAREIANDSYFDLFAKVKAQVTNEQSKKLQNA